MHNELFCSLDSVASRVDEGVIFLAICSSQFTVHTFGNSCYNLLTRRCVPMLVYLKQTSLLAFVFSLPLRLYYVKVTFVVSSARTFLLQFRSLCSLLKVL